MSAYLVNILVDQLGRVFSKIVMVLIGQMLVDQKRHQIKMVAYMVNAKLTKKAK